jgi:hypothetical protein
MGSSKSKNRNYEDLSEIDSIHHLDHIQLLLYHNHNVSLEKLPNLTPNDIKIEYGNLLLDDGIKKSNLDTVKNLVEDYSVEITSFDLEKACRFSDSEIIEYLLENYTSFSEEDKERLYIENLLINRNLTNDQSSDIIKVVILKDLIDVDKLYDNNFNRTIIMILLELKNNESIKYLIETGKYTTLDKKDYTGRTALMNASEDGNAEIVELLLEYGADPYIKKNYQNKTAIELAKGHAVGVFKKRNLHPPLPEKYKVIDDKELISNCNDREDFISHENIRNLEEVYMIKQSDDSYNCYSLEEVLHIRELKKNKNFDKLKRLGNWTHISEDFGIRRKK